MHCDSHSACVRLVGLLLALVYSPAIVAADDATPTAGLSTTRPADGPAVEVDGGFMVPYTETIPGTNVTFEMVPIPGGEFLLGSPADEPERSEDEGPQVQVRVEPMWVGRCEVTWAEYKAYMATYRAFKSFEQIVNAAATRGGETNAATATVAAHVVPDEASDAQLVDAVTCPTPLYDSSYTYSAGEEPNQPAVTMTPFAARQYAKWLSGITGHEYRLPTEAEWEYFARAGTTTPYYFGADSDELGDHAWFDDNADWETHPVGTKSPNAWGLYDVLGNAAEWTLDEYDASRYANLADSHESLPVAVADAVSWPTKLFPRSIRGGSWLDTADRCRVAARQASEDEEWKLSDPNIPLSPWWYTEEPAMGVGMRIVRPLAGIPAADKPRVWDAETKRIANDVQVRLEEGRGVRGVADSSLPAATEAARKLTD